MTAARLRTAALLLLLLAPYFTALGTPDLWDANETLYAEPPREALETGDWLVPTMNYEPWFVKPPGVTWLLLPFYAVLGPTEFAGRLPIALAAALTVLVTWRVGTRLGGERAGLLAAAILATTAKYWSFARQLAGDVFLTAALAVAAWGYLRWVRDGRRGGLHLGAVALAVGVLCKGPIALVLAGLALLADRLVRPRPAQRLRPWGPLLVCLAIAAPWFLYMSLRYDHFAAVYFVRHHLARATTDVFGGGRGVLFYPLAFLGDALPWSVALVVAVIAFLRGGRGGRWREDPRTRPLLWSVLVFGLFTLSTGKRSVYLLPAYPGLAVVLALTVDRLADRADGWRTGRWMVWLLAAVAWAFSAGAVALAAIPSMFRSLALPIAVGFLAWAVWTTVAGRRRNLRGACLATVAMWWTFALWTSLHFYWLQPYRPARPLAERVAAEAGPGDPSGRYGVGLQSLTFYGKRPFFSLRDPDALRERCRDAARTWVVLPEEDLDVLTSDPVLRVERIEERPYLQISLPGLLGHKPMERKLVLVRVTPGEAGPSGG